MPSIDLTKLIYLSNVTLNATVAFCEYGRNSDFKKIENRWATELKSPKLYTKKSQLNIQSGYIRKIQTFTIEIQEMISGMLANPDKIGSPQYIFGIVQRVYTNIKCKKSKIKQIGSISVRNNLLIHRFIDINYEESMPEIVKSCIKKFYQNTWFFVLSWHDIFFAMNEIEKIEKSNLNKWLKQNNYGASYNKFIKAGYWNLNQIVCDFKKTMDLTALDIGKAKKLLKSLQTLDKNDDGTINTQRIDFWQYADIAQNISTIDSFLTRINGAYDDPNIIILCDHENMFDIKYILSMYGTMSTILTKYTNSIYCPKDIYGHNINPIELKIKTLSSLFHDQTKANIIAMGSSKEHYIACKQAAMAKRCCFLGIGLRENPTISDIWSQCDELNKLLASPKYIEDLIKCKKQIYHFNVIYPSKYNLLLKQLDRNNDNMWSDPFPGGFTYHDRTKRCLLAFKLQIGAIIMYENKIYEIMQKKWRDRSITLLSIEGKTVITISNIDGKEYENKFKVLKVNAIHAEQWLFALRLTCKLCGKCFTTLGLLERHDKEFHGIIGDPKYKLLPGKYIFVANNFKLGRILGTGSYGSVYLGEKKSSSTEIEVFAVKRIKKDKYYNEDPKSVARLERIKQEIEILIILQGHPSIVNICDINEDPLCIHIAMECLEETLFDRIVNSTNNLIVNVERGVKIPTLSEGDAQDITRQILDAAHHMKKKRVNHLDLKLGNIMMVDHVSNKIKIIDYGLAHRAVDNEKITKWCGSTGYWAPQIVQKIPYDGFQADMWSIGVIAYIMGIGHHPFKPSGSDDLNTVIENVKNGFSHDFEFKFSGCFPSFEEYWRYNEVYWISDEYLDFISDALRYEPEERLSIEEAINHQFIINNE